jgi:dinuclear metal center YbgI/SA1388 family protein
MTGRGGARVTTVADIVSAVDALAPFALAESWDNVGLLLGDAGRDARRVLVALDVTERVLAEAEQAGADVVLAHHPMIFSSVERLTAETRTGRLALLAAGAGRSIIAAHTNLDAAEGGLCDILAGMAGLADLGPLQHGPPVRRYKIVIFVPAEALEAVRSAAFAAGAGHAGPHYAECSFSAPGTGTFRPGAEASPAVGRTGRRNAAPEERLEMVCGERALGAVLAAAGKAHPYEEPAIDVYPLHATQAAPAVGRVGRRPRAATLGALADDVRDALGLGAIRFAGPPDLAVERVAVCSGAGGGLVEAVHASGCAAYVTGELKYHEVEGLAAAGIGVILGGHFRTERVPLEAWTPRLASRLDIDVAMSQAEDDPISVR